MKKIHHFIGEFNLANRVIVIDDTSLVHHIRDVLHLELGEYIILSNGKKQEARATITQLEKDTITVTTEQLAENQRELAGSIRLYCSILKRENFEWVVQKATEIGVNFICPLLTERTIKTKLNYVRLNKIIHEAAEQAERGIVPELGEAIEFKNIICQPPSNSFVCDARGVSIPSSGSTKSTSVALFIGPEGGWSEVELQFVRDNNVALLSLGPTILRAETAAIGSCFWARFIYNLQ
jgi:16S rRNA (uracil1498-N3)-methyltransferase